MRGCSNVRATAFRSADPTTKELFSSNILFDVAQHSLITSMTHSHHFFIFRRIFDHQFLHNVVEIAPFIPSSDPLPRLYPFLVFHPHHSRLQKLQKLLIEFMHSSYHAIKNKIKNYATDKVKNSDIVDDK